MSTPERRPLLLQVNWAAAHHQLTRWATARQQHWDAVHTDLDAAHAASGHALRTHLRRWGAHATPEDHQRARELAQAAQRGGAHLALCLAHPDVRAVAMAVARGHADVSQAPAVHGAPDRSVAPTKLAPSATHRRAQQRLARLRQPRKKRKVQKGAEKKLPAPKTPPGGPSGA